MPDSSDTALPPVAPLSSVQLRGVQAVEGAVAESSGPIATMIAAAAMSLSSVSVIANALRLRSLRL